VVTDWHEYGGPPLLEVRGDSGKEVLIPFVKAICTEIDPAARRILVDLPEGLEE
jgi:16S rRNA processing protein RimM